jgi:hypothetical protein
MLVHICIVAPIMSKSVISVRGWSKVGQDSDSQNFSGAKIEVMVLTSNDEGRVNLHVSPRESSQ